MSEWLPIETAPRDGTEIFVGAFIEADPDVVHLFPSGWCTWIDSWEERSFDSWERVKDTKDERIEVRKTIRFSGWSMGAGEPTHWMPIPDGPCVGSEGS